MLWLLKQHPRGGGGVDHVDVRRSLHLLVQHSQATRGRRRTTTSSCCAGSTASPTTAPTSSGCRARVMLVRKSRDGWSVGMEDVLEDQTCLRAFHCPKVHDLGIQGAWHSPRHPHFQPPAGHYVPTLALEILRGNEGADAPPINLKGLLVGNAWTDAQLDNHGALEFWFSHGLISFTAYKGIKKYCDFGSVGPLQQVGCVWV